MVEHWSPKPGVAGSSPVTPANFIDMNGRFEIVTGCMKSGKSQYAIETYESLRHGGRSVAAFQPESNTRDKNISSRTGISIPAAKISTLEAVECSKYDAVIADEFHLFDNPSAEIAWCQAARERGTIVLAAMIDYDYRGIKMPAYDLAESAAPDFIHYLTARCDEPVDCDQPARYTAMLVNGQQQTSGPQIIIESNDIDYSPRCATHFLPIQTDYCV